jgi:hypothetical protein
MSAARRYLNLMLRQAGGGESIAMASERRREIKRRRKRREKRLKARVREARKQHKKKRA